MHAIASIRQLTQTEPSSRSSVNSLRVAFIQSVAHLGTRAAVRLEQATVLERYRSSFLRAQLPGPLLCSVAELQRALTIDAPWVAVLDADEVSPAELIALLEIQSASRERGMALQLIAWCSQSTRPAKLWHLFQAGAYLCEPSTQPEALLRACQSAARGNRAPLLRFSERAGFSSAERRAFLAECAGLSKCEAADELGCSQRTLETYWSRIFAKLRIRSTDGVVAAALRFAMLDPGSAAA